MTSEFKLKDWQKVIIDCVNGHETLVGSQNFQSLSDYDINRQTSLRIKLPKGIGHTTLTAYIANKYPSLVVYLDAKHLKEIEDIGSLWNVKHNKDTETISIYELLYFQNQNASVRTIYRNNLEDIKKKFNNKQVVVVDATSTMPIYLEGLEDIIWPLAKGIVILLG
jgi:hypothetical protein